MSDDSGKPSRRPAKEWRASRVILRCTGRNCQKTLIGHRTDGGEVVPAGTDGACSECGAADFEVVEEVDLLDD